jgi:hypothetical protein
MANYETLIASIKGAIKNNNTQAITGQVLQDAMLNIVSQLGKNTAFEGVAIPSTNPGTPTVNTVYMASEDGIYKHFGNIELKAREVSFLIWDGENWRKEDISIEQNIYTGDIVNAPDEEDITETEDKKLKLKDRSFGDGMGYVILRKNKTFAEQVKKSNTIYEIRYDFDLGGATITMPEGCELKFEGGSLMNGTINLNNDCEVVGVGMRCDISNPSKISVPLSRYLADVSDPALNHRVVQALLDAGVEVLDDIPSITFSDYLSIKSRAAFVGLGDRNELIFANSRGFVWDTVSYSSFNRFENLTIESNGTSFDFVNGGSSNAPYNMYMSCFKNLYVTSLNGDCFSSGVDNRGASNDSVSFDNEFSNIFVTAPNGCGFVGQMSICQRFLHIRCGEIGGEALFYNCDGYFEGCNAAYAHPKTFYKTRRRTNGGDLTFVSRFVKCNIEDFTSTIFDCYDSYVYMNMSFEDCVFYIGSNPTSGTIDFYPFDFYHLNSLTWRSNLVMFKNGSTYASPYKMWRIYRFAFSNYTVDSSMDVRYQNDYVSTIMPTESKVKSGAFEVQFYNQSYKHIERFSAGIVNADRIWMNIVTKNITTLTPDLKLPAAEALASLYEVTYSEALDVAENHLFEYVSVPGLLTSSSYAKFPAMTFILRNGAKNRKIKIKHNLGYNGRFFCATGSDIVLNPGDSVRITRHNNALGTTFAYYYVETFNIKPSAGTSKPTSSLEVGQMFFDTTIGKPIWWNGSKWVDATGTAV